MFYLFLIVEEKQITNIIYTIIIAQVRLGYHYLLISINSQILREMNNYHFGFKSLNDVETYSN